MHLGCICVLLLSLALGWTGAQQSNYTRPVFLCGGDLVADSGFVGSEGFPSFYKPNSKCTWRITVPEGNVVTLSFRIFDLEADSLCRYDYLDVFNGHSNLVQKLGRFCGTFRPGALISTTNTMMLQMVSDDATNGRGFVAYFSGAKPYVDATDQQFCGGKITKAQGEIMTPNWPDKKYPAGTSCSWLVTVDPDKVIQVNFDKFVLESDTYCRFDYVTFYNGGEKDDSRLIGRFCGDQAPQPIITSGNTMLVQFVSDLSVTSDGFLARYTSIAPGTYTPTVNAGTGPKVVPPKPDVKPVTPKRPVARPPVPTTKYIPPPEPKPTEKPVKPTRGRTSQRPNGKRPASQNPLCAKACKRGGAIRSSFCSSEFVITAKVDSLTPGPRGSVSIGVTLIKSYKEGRLTLTDVGDNMSVKLVSQCRSCPVLRKGGSYILMGQVDEDGRGTLEPGVFLAPYKPPHHRLLTNLSNQPC